MENLIKTLARKVTREVNRQVSKKASKTGKVFVQTYTKKNGTVVLAHVRSYPGCVKKAPSKRAA
jgi:hypothetical protein